MDKRIEDETQPRMYGFILQHPEKRLQYHYGPADQAGTVKQRFEGAGFKVIGEAFVSQTGPKSEDFFMIDLCNIIDALERDPNADIRALIQEVEKKHK